MKKRVSLRAKIVTGFVPLIVFFSICAVYIYTQTNLSKRILTDTLGPKEQLVSKLHELKNMVALSNSYSLYWVTQPKDSPEKAALKRIHDQEFPALRAEIDSLRDVWENEQEAQVADTALQSFALLQGKQREIMLLLDIPESYSDPLTLFDANDLMERHIIPASGQVYRQIDHLLKTKEQDMVQAKFEVVDSLDDLQFLVLLQLLAVVISGIGLSWVTANQIARPILLVIERIQALSKGILPTNIDHIGKDETGDMAKAVNELIGGLRRTAEFANEIGQEKFETQFEPLSEQDNLGNALLNMRANLQKAAQEDERRNWANEGFARFSEVMRQRFDNTDEMAYTLVRALVKYIGANQGGLFITTGSGNQLNLRLAACYAWEKRKYQQKTVEPGEGLVGQVFLERTTVVMTEIPDDYIRITSGLGSSTPGCIAIVPLLFNDEVQGVLEIASFKPFTPFEINFLEKIAETIASTLSTAAVNEQTKRLLEESQMMAEQLRAQEEEMRQNVEELMATQEEAVRRNHEYEARIREYEARLKIS